MLLKFAALLAAWPLSVLAAPAAVDTQSRRLKPFSTFSDVVVYSPPADYIIPRTLYARTALLENGVLLATWENYSPEPPLVYFPIYKSVDGGETWKAISNVTDTVNGWGLRYQPFLYELPVAIGHFPAGTVLAAGNSIPTDLSLTKIDIYASSDKGYTWKFVSSVASGGEALPNNGLTPVWEPFLQVYKGQLVCYYSDQGDPLHGQKLVHKVSSDLKTWGPSVDDVSYSTYTDRPGMTTVVQLPNKKWMMTYEYGGGPYGGDTDYAFPIYYRISDSPLTFNNSVGIPIIASGKYGFGSPYLVWSPAGGKHGTIAVSDGTNTGIFINKNLGDAKAWTYHETPQPAAYTRHLRVMNNPEHLLIMGGGVLSGTANNVSLSVINIP